MSIFKSKKVLQPPPPPLVGIELNPGPPRGKHLSDETKWRIVSLSDYTSRSISNISRTLGVSRFSVRNVLNKYRRTQSVDNVHSGGRKRKLSASEERKVLNQAKKGKTSPQIAQNLETKAGVRTLRRTIRSSGLRWLRNQTTDAITPEQAAKRVEFCHAMKDFNWKTAVFTDEKTFSLDSIPTHSWQQPGKRRKVGVRRHPPKLHVWGGIGHYFWTDLYFFTTNLDARLYQSIVNSRLPPKYFRDCPRKLRRSWVFVQDNDPKHRAKKMKELLDDIAPDRIQNWPSNSPDFNIMEDAWGHLDLKARESTATTISGLKRVLTKAWNDYSLSKIRNSVASLPARLQQAIERNGERTDY